MVLIIFMKKNNIIVGVAIFSFLALLSGGWIATNIANADTSVSPTIANSMRQDQQFTRRGFNLLNSKQRTTFNDQQAAHRAEWTARRTAIHQTLDNNDYSAWLKAVGADSFLVKKITPANFSQYLKAYNLKQEANKIMLSLGVDHNELREHMQGEMRAGHQLRGQSRFMMQNSHARYFQQK